MSARYELIKPINALSISRLEPVAAIQHHLLYSRDIKYTINTSFFQHFLLTMKYLRLSDEEWTLFVDEIDKLSVYNQLYGIRY